jgi:hypothetical protein
VTDSLPPVPGDGTPTYPGGGGRGPSHASWSPARTSWGEQPYAAYGGYPQPSAPPKSVTGLGIATQVMLALQLLASVALLFPTVHQHTLINRIRNDSGSVTLSEAQRADDRVSALSGVVLVLYLATGVVWVIWFYRTRRNVEAWSPVFQRRTTGWAIGAWVCPIVNLWFPYMIVKDVFDDTERPVQGAYLARRSRPLLVVWWTSFVALFVVAIVERGVGDPKSLDDLTLYTNTEIVAVVVRIVSAVLAIVVVRQLTTAQTNRRRRDAGA